LTTQDINRKLAAILSADVKGYSRLMGEDEKGTGGKGSRIPGFKGPNVLGCLEYSPDISLRNEIPMIRSRWGIELFHFLV
jgi:hypothetical protein